MSTLERMGGENPHLAPMSKQIKPVPQVVVVEKTDQRPAIVMTRIVTQVVRKTAVWIFVTATIEFIVILYLWGSK